MKILYLGAIMPQNFHEQNTIFTFLKHGYEVSVINVNRCYFTDEITGIGKVEICNIYEDGDPYKGKIGRIYWELNNLGLIKGYKDIKDKMNRFIKKVNPDIIYCFFGSGIFNEMNMILEMKLGIPLIHNLLCYPVALSYQSVKRENRQYSKIINSISGRIYPAETMFNYVKGGINPNKGVDIILMEYFSEKYFPHKRLPLLSSVNNEPHLIFLGRTDFSSNRLIDDIREHILEFVKAGIHIHLRAPATNLPQNKYIHIFPTFDSSRTFNGELSTFMTQFDGCLVLYNFVSRYCKDRFYNTLPSRFLFGMTTSIPIVLPEKSLISCEEMVKQYNIGLIYRDVDDLKEKLYDRTTMEILRKNALTNYKNFTYENNFYKLDNWIKKIIT
ncbi:MAG: hypothetical protein PHE49_01815 [bacterium]|nr:hypothetical protein [bacterium]